MVSRHTVQAYECAPSGPVAVDEAPAALDEDGIPGVRALLADELHVGLVVGALGAPRHDHAVQTRVRAEQLEHLRVRAPARLDAQQHLLRAARRRRLVERHLRQVLRAQPQEDRATRELEFE